MNRCVLPLSLMMLASCSDGAQQAVVNASVIGNRPALVDPDRGPVQPGSALLLAASSQGLVRLNDAGQVVPGLAERWIVTDDGLSLIFRIHRQNWADGREIKSEDIAQDLKRHLQSANRIAPYMTGIEKVSSMTGRVIEIRMTMPQPRMLELLAQPEAAITRRSIGSGPLRLRSSKGGVYVLAALPEEGRPGREMVRLRGEAAGHAVSRYLSGDTHLVTNGSFADLPFARAAKRPDRQLRFDPANGLFGLVFTSRSPFLASAEVRSALSMAVDRESLIRAFGVGSWRQAVSNVPSQLDLPAPPSAQDWLQLAQDDRVSRASGLIAAWRVKNGDPPVVRVSLPRGPGARLLFAALRASWARIGIRVIAAPSGAADLRLIDEVSPHASALWYLSRLSCANGYPCDEKAESALKAARLTTDPAVRTAKLAEADAALALTTPFIPLATPLRWSLVSPELAGWRENGFAFHPLDYLRAVKR